MIRTNLGMPFVFLVLGPAFWSCAEAETETSGVLPRAMVPADSKAEPRAERQTATGTFSGTTIDGYAVVISVEQESGAVRGVGTVGGEEIVLSGPVGWAAVATLTDSRGVSQLVRLRLSADGDALTIERASGEQVILHRGGNRVSRPSGPFSGSYRAVRDKALLAEVTMVQSGSLLSGVGTVLGSTAGLSGHVTDSNQARGTRRTTAQSRPREVRASRTW